MASSPPTFDRLDRNLLQEHVLQCHFASGPMYRVHCAIEAAHRFLAPRFVTTLAVALSAVVLLGVSLPS